MGFSERYQQMCSQLAECCKAAGRPADAARILAVSKTVGVDEVRRAVDAGAHDFGENRPDCIMEKSAAFPRESWHFIGNIQSRRIPDIVRCSALIHSLYQEGHARKIDAAAASLGKVQDVLLEVNVSGEASKGGIAPQDLASLAQLCVHLPNIRLRGLMTMAPQGDPETAREVFRELSHLQADLRATLAPSDAAVLNEVSMGMSEDWREAVQEGATIVRIGRALFSDEFNLA